MRPQPATFKQKTKKQESSATSTIITEIYLHPISGVQVIIQYSSHQPRPYYLLPLDHPKLRSLCYKPLFIQLLPFQHQWQHKHAPGIEIHYLYPPINGDIHIKYVILCSKSFPHDLTKEPLDQWLDFMFSIGKHWIEGGNLQLRYGDQSAATDKAAKLHLLVEERVLFSKYKVERHGEYIRGGIREGGEGLREVMGS